MPIKDDKSDAGSQASKASRPIDEIVGVKKADPRVKTSVKHLQPVKESKAENYLSKENLDAHNVKYN